MSFDSTLGSVQSLSNTVATGVNIVTRAAADVGLTKIGGKAKYWADSLRPASYRGIPFGVLGGEIRFGRRNAVHEYPYRDTVWVEDLGRAARRIVMSGFLVENGAYTAAMAGPMPGAVIDQRDRLIKAVESPGDGELVHPTLGRMTVSLMDFSSVERWDQGRMFELSFVFVESGRRVFPAVATSTGDAVLSAASQADAAAQKDFASKVGDALKHGAAVVRQAATTATSWANQAQRLANDATNTFNLLGRLSGNNGRFFGGRSGAAKNIDSVAGLIAIGATARTQVASAVSDLISTAGKLGL